MKNIISVCFLINIGCFAGDQPKPKKAINPAIVRIQQGNQFSSQTVLPPKGPKQAHQTVPSKSKKINNSYSPHNSKSKQVQSPNQ